jgi:RNA ligase (TIGR02306 family)
MSSVIVEVATIDNVLPHPNADRLCLARIKGWQTVIRQRDDGTPEFRPGERVVYIPPDATLPRAMADELGVLNYLAERTDMDGETVHVVRRTRLRGEPSYGFAIRPADAAWEVGRDVREHYGIGKFRPPVKLSAGDSEANHPLVHHYTEVENLRHFPTAIADGEEVVVHEKVHGTNARIGIVDGQLLAGSRALQRQRPEDSAMAANTYWYPATLAPVTALLDELKALHKVVILFGEIYGSKIQKLHYGRKGSIGFAAFDLYAGEGYVDHDAFAEICERHGVVTVPLVGRGPFSLDWIRELSAGKTTYDDNHIREGVVVKPTRERLDPKIGRVVLKYLNDDYLTNSKLTAADATDL